ncbi:MAG: HmuY family protein [Nitrospinae bacterium]|nr:HmuY family protein [Nitrospinota bacterium]
MSKNLVKYFLIANLVIFIGIIFSLYYLSNLNIPEPPPGSEKIIASKISNPEPNDVGENLSAEMIFTINASSPNDWIYLDFSKGAIVTISDRSSADWDIGFRRAKIMSNSGASNPAGKGGILVIEGVEFESVVEAPESGYMTDIRKNPAETENPAAEKWYVYDFMTHHLKPKKNVYIIRTADGKYAKMQIMKYYLEGIAGYYTIRYVYQGNGSRRFSKPR